MQLKNEFNVWNCRWVSCSIFNDTEKYFNRSYMFYWKLLVFLLLPKLLHYWLNPKIHTSNLTLSHARWICLVFYCMLRNYRTRWNLRCFSDATYINPSCMPKQLKINHSRLEKSLGLLSNKKFPRALLIICF